jgi:nuclear transport factor 2 (NTF2) superfamily protein
VALYNRRIRLGNQKKVIMIIEFLKRIWNTEKEYKDKDPLWSYAKTEFRNDTEYAYNMLKQNKKHELLKKQFKFWI